MGYPTLKNNIGLAKREILALVYKYKFKTSMYMAFPTSTNPADRNFRLTPPGLLPCEAWHGNRATIAHHEEVGVSADGPRSAPPSEAAADAPPAGALSL
jgi:hypothetical protein